jgi:hypothetical protein
VKRGALIIAGIAGMLVIGWIALWLANGGRPASGPAGYVLPPHIQKVNPADGETVIAPRGFCVDFFFQAENGMGFDPERTLRFFLDGINVTKKVHGVVTLDYPPSGGSLCYNPDTPFSPGWHTVKVNYTDSQNQKFEYIWRFQVKSKK